MLPTCGQKTETSARFLRRMAASSSHRVGADAAGVVGLDRHSAAHHCPLGTHRQAGWSQRDFGVGKSLQSFCFRAVAGKAPNRSSKISAGNALEERFKTKKVTFASLVELEFPPICVIMFPRQREAVGDSASAAEIMNLNNKNAVASAGDNLSLELNQG